jgi:hypothetical protein
MNWALWLVMAVAAAVMVASAAMAGSSPRFWWGLAQIAFGEFWPSIVKAVAPKDFSPEQRRQMDMGEEPTIHPRFPKRLGSGGSS